MTNDHLLAIHVSWPEQVAFGWNDDDVRFVLD